MLLSIPLLTRTHPIMGAPPSGPYLNLYLPKAPTPTTGTLGVRASPYEFGGKGTNIQSLGPCVSAKTWDVSWEKPG
jgi:hypothetical protein